MRYKIRLYNLWRMLLDSMFEILFIIKIIIMILLLPNYLCLVVLYNEHYPRLDLSIQSLEFLSQFYNFYTSSLI